MAFAQPESILACVQQESSHTVEFWWMGCPGEWGAQVIKVDPHGMRWTLDMKSTHWVTQRIAAGLLGVSVMTVNRWARDGVFGETKTRNGVSVISLRAVERIAEARGILRST